MEGRVELEKEDVDLQHTLRIIYTNERRHRRGQVSQQTTHFLPALSLSLLQDESWVLQRRSRKPGKRGSACGKRGIKEKDAKGLRGLLGASRKRKKKNRGRQGGMKEKERFWSRNGYRRLHGIARKWSEEGTAKMQKKVECMWFDCLSNSWGLLHCQKL